MTAADLARVDMPAAVVEADVHLRDLLAHPPLGHVEDPQPDDWYKHVFADMAAAHEDRITGGQS